MLIHVSRRSPEWRYWGTVESLSSGHEWENLDNLCCVCRGVRSPGLLFSLFLIIRRTDSFITQSVHCYPACLAEALCRVFLTMDHSVQTLSLKPFLFKCQWMWFEHTKKSGLKNILTHKGNNEITGTDKMEILYFKSKITEMENPPMGTAWGTFLLLW